VEPLLSELAEFHDAAGRGEDWAAAAESQAMEWRLGDPFPEDVRAAEAEALDPARHPPTDPDAPERQADQARWLAEVEAERRAGVEVRQERQAWIVIGPPAAGKSTIVEPLARQVGALVVDSDDVKAKIPEYRGGIGANAVHAESADLAAELLSRAVVRGDNLALPRVGSEEAGLRRLIDGLREASYEVHLLLADLPVEKAANRAIQRFRRDGRFVPLGYLINAVGDRPATYFETLKGEVATHARYSTDVAEGEAPRFVEGTDVLRLGGSRADRAGGDQPPPSPGDGGAAPPAGGGAGPGGRPAAAADDGDAGGAGPAAAGRARAERNLNSETGEPRRPFASAREDYLDAPLPDRVRRAIGECGARPRRATCPTPTRWAARSSGAAPPPPRTRHWTPRDALTHELRRRNSPMSRRRLNILVVDDEILVATAVEDVLAGAGHQVAVAFGAEEAIATLARLPVLDAVILDLQLPDGSGAEVLRALRGRWPGLPVVISTGYALDGAERAALDPAQGRGVVLKKPWTEAQLLAALDNATRVPAG
jgi:CheY-like chemotaxis protein